MLDLTIQPAANSRAESRQARGHPLSRVNRTDAAVEVKSMQAATKRKDVLTDSRSMQPDVDLDPSRTRGRSRVWLRNTSLDFGAADLGAQSKIPQLKP